MRKTKKALALLLALGLLFTALPVSALAADGETDPGAGARTPELPAPKLKKAVAVKGGVTFTWGRVTGAKKYRVLRRLEKGKWKPLKDTAAVSVTDRTVKSGKKYSYTVRCVSKDGKTVLSKYNAKGKTLRYIAVPVLRKPKTVSKGVRLRWKKVTGAKKYRVFRKTGGGDWKKVGNTKKTRFLDKTADRCIAYAYTVRCTTGDGKSYTSGMDEKGKTITSPHRYDVSKLKAAKKYSQIIVVTVDGRRKDLIMYQKQKDGSWKKLLSTPATIGENGLGKRKEGDHKTPVGNYRFTKALGIKKNPGTVLPYTKVDKTHYWVDDSGSRKYNLLVSTRNFTDFSSGEHIIEYKKVYNYILAISWNEKRIPRKGSAIFLHCWRRKNSSTWGCVGVPQKQMIKIMRKVRPGCRIIIDYAKKIKKY